MNILIGSILVGVGLYLSTKLEINSTTDDKETFMDHMNNRNSEDAKSPYTCSHNRRMSSNWGQDWRYQNKYNELISWGSTPENARYQAEKYMKDHKYWR